MTANGVHDPRVVALLKQDMPRMQPSALKHEYLTSVANVLRHPIAHIADDEREPDGAIRVIGFADVHRSLPLSLIVEPPPDRSVRHAFVPNPRDPVDAELLEALQADENQWTAERGIPSRNIAGQIRHRGRGEVNRHGINHYDPPSPFTKADIDGFIGDGWYPTRPLPEHLEVDHSSRPELDGDTLDRRRLEANAAVSAKMAAGSKEKRRFAVALQPGQQRRLLLERLEATDPEPDDDEPQY